MMTFKHWLSHEDTDLGGLTPNIAWHLPLHGMVRTPIPDIDDASALYVVTYREKFREYGVYRLDRDSGSIRWNTLIRNGGYGSPLVHRDGVFALSRFTAVTGLDKDTGEIRFEFDAHKRIRSSVSRGLADDEILFTAGNEIHWLATDGTPRHCVALESTFFFGLPEAVRDGDDEVVITLATRQRFRKSHVYVCAVGRDGAVRWQHDLGHGFVVSSDTSGVALTDELVIASAADGRVVAIDRFDGTPRWEARIDGLAVRHLPVVGAGRVFVTTLEGSLCSVALDGSDVRTLPLTDRGVWMPPTVVGDAVFVVADNEMLQLATTDLAVLSRTAVGEAPYTQMSFDGQRIYIGGGDPPYDGYLFALDLGGEHRQVAATAVREVHDAARSDDVVVSLRVLGETAGLGDVEIDLRSLGGEVTVASKLRPGLFSAQCKLGRGRRFGTYALPVLLHYGDGDVVVRTIRVRIEDSTPIPVRHEIDITVPRQTGINTSGGAVLQAVFEHYGRSVDQREIRRIADHALEVSDDYSPFQLWRLVTRRVAATGANSLEEFEMRGC